MPRKIFERLLPRKKSKHNHTIPKALDVVKKQLEERFKDSDDIAIHEFSLPLKLDLDTQAVLVYIKGMVNQDAVFEQVLRNLVLGLRQISHLEKLPQESIKMIKDIITVAEVSEKSSWDDVILDLVSGSALVFIDGQKFALSINVAQGERRGVEQPVTEAVIRGPRDSFSETLTINISLVRRRLKDPRLKVKKYVIGERSRTETALLYIEDIIDSGVLEEIKKRLETIRIDSLTDSGYLEQLITDTWWSLFNTTQESERPDEVVGGLLEGRFAILVDNTPFAILAPTTINTLMHSPEDYYLSWIGSSLVRFVRFIGSFIAFVLPGLYIALVTYHPEMIPTQLALSISATRTGIPFPVVVEAFIMELAFELLREAGIRLPGPIGQTIGIVGGIIIGEAAVGAGIVSPIMVIIVATTAIASFLIPTYSLTVTLRTLRFFVMILSALLGLFGLVLGVLIIGGHLCILKSFGVSMLSPWTPLRISDFQDSLIKLPLIATKNRPVFGRPQDRRRLVDKRPNDLKRGRTE